MKLSEIPKQRWLLWVALGTLGLGFITVLVTVVAPLGYRLNIWVYHTAYHGTPMDLHRRYRCSDNSGHWVSGTQVENG